MKKCPFCGAVIEENARFCLYCMKELEEKAVMDGKQSFWKTYKTRLIFLCAAVALLIVILLLVSFCSGPGQTDDAGEGLPSAGQTQTTSSGGSAPESSGALSGESGDETASGDDVLNKGDTTSAGEGSDESTQETSGSGGTQSAGSTSSAGNGSDESESTETSGGSHNTGGEPGSGTSSGTNSETSSGTSSGTNSGTTSGTNSDESEPAETSGGSQNTGSGTSSGTSSGTNSGTSSGTSSGTTSDESEPAETSGGGSSNTGESSGSGTSTEDPEPSTSQPPVEQVTYTYRDAQFYNLIDAADKADKGLLAQNAVVITGVETIAESGVYVIPEQIDGKKVVAVMEGAFSDPEVRGTVKKVVLPASIHSVWETFQYCNNLTDLYFSGTSVVVTPYIFSLTPNKEQLTVHAASDCVCYYGSTGKCTLKERVEWFKIRFQSWNGGSIF